MDFDRSAAEGPDLFPASIVAGGISPRPDERLIALQGAIARGVAWLAGLSFPAFRFSPLTAPLQQGDRK